MSASEKKNAEIPVVTSAISVVSGDGVTESHGTGGAASDSESAAETTTPGGTPEVMTVDEVAALVRVDRNTVYGCIRRGELAVCRCGRIIRIHHDAVVEWLRGNTRVTRSSRRRSS